MLRLDVAPALLAGGALLGADDRNPHLAWAVPAALAVVAGADGTPGFVLCRHAGAYGSGGNLLVSLQPQMPDASAQAAGRTVSLVPLRSFQARLRVTGEGGIQISDWRTAQVTPGGPVLFSASFSPREMDALAPALDDTPAPIAVDAVFSYAGVYPGLPLVATVQLAAFVARMQAALPAGPVPMGAFVATGVALLALDPTLYKTTATDDGAPPDPSAVLVEVVARLTPTLVVSTPGADPESPVTVTLSTATPGATVNVDLSSPRIETRTATATWSVGSFLSGLDAAGRARALPSLTNPDVLSALSVQVMTSAPFDPRYLTRVDVGLRYHDAAGKLQQPSVSLVDGARAQTIDVVRNVMAPFTIEQRVTAIVSPDGAPRVLQQGYAAAGAIVDLDGAALGLRFVATSVDPDVFASAGAVVLDLRGAADPSSTVLVSVTLDATTPASTVVVPGAAPGQPLWASIRALPPAGAGGPAAGVVVADRAVADRVDVAAADVVPQAPIPVAIARAATATADRFPTITVTVRAPGTADALFKLGPAARTYSLFATSPFAAPTFQYKVDWIDNTKGFDTISGSFHTAATTALTIDPQTEPHA